MNTFIRRVAVRSSFMVPTRQLETTIGSAAKLVGAGTCTVGVAGSGAGYRSLLGSLIIYRNPSRYYSSEGYSKMSKYDLLVHVGKLKSDLNQVTSKLIERDGLVVLRSHVEITEGLYLACHPIPTSMAEYKRQLELRKMELNEDIVRAIKGELKAEIVWPKSIDVEIKDAMDKKINKHFRIWIWLLYMVDTPEIIAMRNEVGNTSEGIRQLASGIAGLYIYSSFVIRSYGDYSKEELQKYTLPRLHHLLVRPAAELLLKNIWL